MLENKENYVLVITFTQNSMNNLHLQPFSEEIRKSKEWFWRRCWHQPGQEWGRRASWRQSSKSSNSCRTEIINFFFNSSSNRILPTIKGNYKLVGDSRRFLLSHNKLIPPPPRFCNILQTLGKLHQTKTLQKEPKKTPPTSTFSTTFPLIGVPQDSTWWKLGSTILQSQLTPSSTIQSHL